MVSVGLVSGKDSNTVAQDTLAALSEPLKPAEIGNSIQSTFPVMEEDPKDPLV